MMHLAIKLWPVLVLALWLPAENGLGAPRGGSDYASLVDGICQFATSEYVPEAASQRILNQTVQRLLERHKEVFGFRVHAGFRLRMRVYQRFEDFTNASPLKGQVNLEGVYVSRSKEILTYKKQIPATLGVTLLHEASHAIMDEHYDVIQPWMAEGAADYFAYALARNAQSTTYLQRRWALLNAWKREGKLPELGLLLDADHKQWQALDPGVAYAASWSLFQFFMRSESSKRLLASMLVEWQNLQDNRVDCTGQVERLYPGGLKALEKDWHQWIDRTGGADVLKAAFRGTGVCQFATRGYALPANTEQAINQQVATLLAKHRAVFGLAPKPNLHLRVRICNDFNEYAAITTNSLVSGWDVPARNLAKVDGYYSPFTKEIVTWPKGSAEQLAHTVVYLANSPLLEENFARIPRWIESGSPEYFDAAMQPNSDAMEPLKTAWKAAGLQKATLPSVKALLDDSSPVWLDKSTDNENKTEVLCWALFHFLCDSKQNQQVLKTVMEAVQTHRPRPNSAVVVERIYPSGLAGFERDFKKWMGN